MGMVTVLNAIAFALNIFFCLLGISFYLMPETHLPAICLHGRSKSGRTRLWYTPEECILSFVRLLSCFQSAVVKKNTYCIFHFSFNKFPYNMGLTVQLPGSIIKLVFYCHLAVAYLHIIVHE